MIPEILSELRALLDSIFNLQDGFAQSFPGQEFVMRLFFITFAAAAALLDFNPENQSKYDIKSFLRRSQPRISRELIVCDL